MAPPRPFTWRVENIAQGTTSKELLRCFHSDHRNDIQVKSLVPDINNHDGNGCLTATILFSHPTDSKPIIDDGDDLVLDKNFVGFTPLNKASSDVAADIVAITGLAGHAFGSWAHSPEKMWLRDYLPQGIQNRARIMIYGYESQIQGANIAKSILSDYSSTFAENLMDIRDHPSARDRPLILIGHSLGALLIKQAIADLHPSVRKRLPVRTVLFFGAPHRGLHTAALETLVKGQPTAALINELAHESPTLDRLAEQFLGVIGSTFSIHSYYESKPTKTVVKKPDGTLERSGELKVMVTKSSAVLGHLQEVKIKVDGDHSTIAKIFPGQGGVYPNVLRVIKQGLQSASETYAAYSNDSNKQDSAPLPIRVAEPKKEMRMKLEEYRKDPSSVLCLYPRELPQAPRKADPTAKDPPYVFCDWCREGTSKNVKHFHCIICSEGDFDLCEGCKEKGRSCHGEHELLEREIPVVSLEEVKKTESSKLQYCDSKGCNCGLPKTPKKQSSPSSKPKAKRQPSPAPPAITYCDVPDCSCGLPRREKTPIPPVMTKKEITPEPIPTTTETQYCHRPNCNCVLPKRPTSTTAITPTPPKPAPSTLQYCDIPSFSCSLPRTPSTSTTTSLSCLKCKVTFSSRNKLFAHIKESGHGDDDVKATPVVDELTCLKCKEKFPSRNKLFKHVKESGHGEEEKKMVVDPLACLVCKESFPSRTKLFKHINESGHSL